MAFSTPTFNLRAGIWHGQSNDPTLPNLKPLDIDTPAQLRMYKTAFHSPSDAPDVDAAPGTICLCCPANTDIRGFYGLGSAANNATGDKVEVPLGSGRFYRVMYVDDVAKGFANEYRMARLSPIASPLPIP